tara:strand:- start:303 stop:524 length:222 start_codon:yes stop_codon:yes gene_type:complete
MNSFLIGAIISVIYLIFKIIEMRVIIKENKPLKHLLRDSIIVYFSVIVGNFIFEQIGGDSKKLPNVFLDGPNF